MADHEHGRWDHHPGSLRSWPSSESRVAREGWWRIGDPFVRAVARLPVNVRTKLLIAFVGTSLLLVAVGLLGQVVLGQSNDRVASVGPLQERAVQYSQLQGDADHLRAVLAVNEAREFNIIWPDLVPGPIRRTYTLAVDLFARDAADRIGARTAPDRLLFTPPAEDQEILDGIKDKADRLSRVLRDKVIPLYGDSATIPYETEEMLPLRAHAEKLAFHIYQDAADLADGTRHEIQDLIARNESSFASSRTLFISVAAGRALPRPLAGIRPIVVADRAPPADRHSRCRDRIRRLFRTRRSR